MLLEGGLGTLQQVDTSEAHAQALAHPRSEHARTHDLQRIRQMQKTGGAQKEGPHYHCSEAKQDSAAFMKSLGEEEHNDRGEDDCARVLEEKETDVFLDEAELAGQLERKDRIDSHVEAFIHKECD